MKYIKLTKGKRTIIDDDDFDRVSKKKWNFDGRYAMGWHNGKHIRLHKFIMGEKDNLQIDHINEDKLDNRKCNLRFCTRSENIHNKRSSRKNTSGFRGVCWDKERNKWMAYININGKRKTIGRFLDKNEAARMYNNFVIMYYSDSRWLNNPN
jgi:hypothetical protein